MNSHNQYLEVPPIQGTHSLLLYFLSTELIFTINSKLAEKPSNQEVHDQLSRVVWTERIL